MYFTADWWLKTSPFPPACPTAARTPELEAELKSREMQVMVFDDSAGDDPARGEERISLSWGRGDGANLFHTLCNSCSWELPPHSSTCALLPLRSHLRLFPSSFLPWDRHHRRRLCPAGGARKGRPGRGCLPPHQSGHADGGRADRAGHGVAQHAPAARGAARKQ